MRSMQAIEESARQQEEEDTMESWARYTSIEGDI